MQNAPMWGDHLDERAAQPLQQLRTADERAALRGLNGIRVVTRKGWVYEGITDFGTHGISRLSGITVNGKLFSTGVHTFYLLNPAETVTRDPAPLELTQDELRDVIADLCISTPGPRVTAPSLMDIVETVLGFDPAIGLNTSGFGGKSKDGYINQFLKVGALRKSLTSLEADGAIRKLTSGSYLQASADDRYAIIRGRTGYVTTEAWEEAVANVDEGRRLKQLDKLREQAARNVAQRHQDEVDKELTRLAEEAGIRL